MQLSNTKTERQLDLSWILLDLVEVGDFVQTINGESVQGFDLKKLKSLCLEKVSTVELVIFRLEGMVGHKPSWLLSLHHLTCIKTLNIRLNLS